MKRGGPIPARSAKRISDSERRRQVIEEVGTRDGWVCGGVGRIPNHICRSTDELDCHEIIPRSAWPSGYLVADNCVMVCRIAHQWIDLNPEKAHDIGLHGFSWERPDGHCGYFGQGADWGDR